MFLNGKNCNQCVPINVAKLNFNWAFQNFRTVVHYAQEVNSKQFSAYDHGHKENQASSLSQTFGCCYWFRVQNQPGAHNLFFWASPKPTKHHSFAS